MKKLLIILLLTFSIPFAQNCVSMSDEIKTEIKNSHWDNSHTIIFVHDGIVCDKGYFWNGGKKRNKITICIAAYSNENKRLSIFKDSTDTLYYGGLYYDEYGMTIKELPFTKTNKTCIDLYNQFKADMSK